MIKISNLPESKPNSEAVIPFVKDATTYKGKIGDLLNEIFPKNAAARNSVYRGKSLGSLVTEEQWETISDGTFDDLFVGDYWTIDNKKWIIAGFDYWYGTGYPSKVNKHHVVIIPENNIASCKMNNTNTTDGGYTGTDFYTGANGNTGKATANAIITGAFGNEHILERKALLASQASSGVVTNMSVVSSTFELLSLNMIIGSSTTEPVATGTNTPLIQFGYDGRQLPIFQFVPPSAYCNGVWWTRNIATSSRFVLINDSGDIKYEAASSSYGIRPIFGICGDN